MPGRRGRGCRRRSGCRRRAEAFPRRTWWPRRPLQSQCRRVGRRLAGLASSTDCHAPVLTDAEQQFRLGCC
jgi:hypothetical protein